MAYRDLKTNIVQLNERIDGLNNEQKGLLDLRAALISDADRMAREARAIGYLRPGEKMVVFASGDSAASGAAAALRDIEPLRVGASTGLPDRLIKILAALIGGAVFLASLMMAVSPRQRRAAPSAGAARA